MLRRPTIVRRLRWWDWRASGVAAAGAGAGAWIASLAALSLSLPAGVRGQELSATYGAHDGRSYRASRGDYILNCGGCHGFQGVSNARLVPNLKDVVGYYLHTPEGRAYLPRLPNVAFSTLSDAKLAGVLNYLVFELGGASAPARAEPYTAAEVGQWRRQPLTEVNLSEYRRQLVETLITEYRAPAAMRVYGERSEHE